MKNVLILVLFSINLFAQNEFFPTTVGNIWQYKQNVYTIINKTLIQDSIDAENTHFYKFKVDDIYNDNHYFEYWKMDKYNNVWFGFFSSWLLYYDLKRNIYDKPYFCGVTCDSLYAVLSDTQAINVFGQNRKTKRYTLYVNSESLCPDYLADTTHIYLATKFGKFYQNDIKGFTEELVYAKIDNIEYGKQISNIHTYPNNKPQSSFLFSSYPNPFNSHTIITFEINNPSSCSIEIYNLISEKVYQINNKFYISGKYNILWDASLLPGGIYLARLKIDNYTRTIKLTLLK